MAKSSLNLDAKVADTLAFLIGLYPEWTPKYLAGKILFWHGVTITEADIVTAKESLSIEIFEYREGGVKAINKARQLKAIKYLSVYERLEAFSDIAEKGRKGYAEEKATAKGDVVSVTIFNFPAAMTALKEIERIQSEMVKDDDNYPTVFAVLDPEDDSMHDAFVPNDYSDAGGDS